MSPTRANNYNIANGGVADYQADPANAAGLGPASPRERALLRGHRARPLVRPGVLRIRSGHAGRGHSERPRQRLPGHGPEGHAGARNRVRRGACDARAGGLLRPGLRRGYQPADGAPGPARGGGVPQRARIPEQRRGSRRGARTLVEPLRPGRPTANRFRFFLYRVSAHPQPRHHRELRARGLPPAATRRTLQIPGAGIFAGRARTGRHLGGRAVQRGGCARDGTTLRLRTAIPKRQWEPVLLALVLQETGTPIAAGHGSGALDRRVFLPFLPAGGPILLHPFPNFLAFLGVHKLPAAALDILGENRNSAGASLQFLQRSNYPLESLFLGVQLLYRFI